MAILAMSLCSTGILPVIAVVVAVVEPGKEHKEAAEATEHARTGVRLMGKRPCYTKKEVFLRSAINETPNPVRP
jgi:hypothetical protein